MQEKGPRLAGCYETFCWRRNYLLSPADAGWGCFDTPATPVSRQGLPYAARLRGLKAIRCLSYSGSPSSFVTAWLAGLFLRMNFGLGGFGFQELEGFLEGLVAFGWSGFVVLVLNGPADG